MSFLETLVILVVAIVVLGPKRLPEQARKLGRWMGALRRASDEFKRQIMSMDQHVERSVSRAEQSIQQATGDLDQLVPDGDMMEATPAVQPVAPLHHPDELPPTASPDDFWGTTPVAGGLPKEEPIAEATPAEAPASTPPPTTPAVESQPKVVLNPTSFERPAEVSKPRSLGLSPTRPAKSTAKGVSRG